MIHVVCADLSHQRILIHCKHSGYSGAPVTAAMEVIPISPMDLPMPVPNIRTRNFFIIDDRLDEKVLKDGLTKLIKDHWRKLGARLVGTVEKAQALVYHLPHEFANDYELFRWSSKKYDHSINNIAGKFLRRQQVDSDSSEKPQQAQGVRILPSTEDIDSWFRPSDWPLEVKDDVSAPLLLIHLSVFTDASVLTISVPHIFADQLGTANIMRAWLGVIAGTAPPPMLGFDEDILPGKTPIKEIPKEKLYEKNNIHLRKFGRRFLVVLGYIPELVLEAEEEAKCLFFPRSVVQNLRERHVKALLARKKETREGEEEIQLTNGDIMTAVLAKFFRMGKRGKRTVNLVQVVNLRGRVPELATPEKSQGYLHNCLTYGAAALPFSHSLPLGEIALRTRKAIKKAMDPQEIEVRSAVMREMVRKNQANPVHICEPFEKSICVSNWTPAWRGLDFSPALTADAKAARGENNDKPLRLVVVGRGGELKGPHRFIARIMSTMDDGYVLDFRASTKVYKAVEEYLAKDPLLEQL